MSKINQIETALLQLDGGSFQKLADAYLYKKGYTAINPLGSVIGADKVRKGTPDTLVRLPCGKYVFAEYTTIQQEKVYGKIGGDLDKCFDETKTGIPLSNIQEVVFCHTSILSAKEESALAEKCQMKGVNLNLFGIGRISHDLYLYYRGLAHDFLGIDVDTGQIVYIDEFIGNYNKNRFATRLDTAFQFHEVEIDQILQGLGICDLVIVSGRAGIGKTRLALECCEKFKDLHGEYEVRCVSNRGPDLFNDLNIYFSESGHFLILVDDANRINRFEYIIQLLQYHREDQRIKVIVTVRDYAHANILGLSQLYGSYIDVKLLPLKDEQIKQLVIKEYDIHHPLYLDRIANIAQGNPRLAIMAAEVEKKEGFLSLIDVTALYEKYFATIRNDIADLQDRNILKTAGIIMFFQSVDLSNTELMNKIEDAFKISQDIFWEATLRLHDLEVVDMHEGEVVRISDQVLATYLFYLAFFKDRLLNFSDILDHLFPNFQDKIVDAINPVLNAFNSDAIEKTMLSHVSKTWDSLKTASNDEALFQLMKIFWFLKPTQTLLCIKDQIDEMIEEPADISRIKFEADSFVPPSSLLSLLRLFSHLDVEIAQNAVDLLLRYVARQPNDVPFVLHILAEDYGYKHISYIRNFAIQKMVIEVLWRNTHNGEDSLYSKLFIFIGKQYLHTYFQELEMKGRITITIHKCILPPTTDVFELRRDILVHLFELFNKPMLHSDVLSVLHSYRTLIYPDPVKEIIAKDMEEIIPFINSRLDPTSYNHCLIVHEYLDILDEFRFTYDVTLREQFTNEAYLVSKILLIDWLEKCELDIDEYEKLKRENVREYFDNFSLNDYEKFFKLCIEIYEILGSDNKAYQLGSGISEVFMVLAEEKHELYVKVLEYYLNLGNPFDLNFIPLIRNLIKIVGAQNAYEFICRHKHPKRRAILFDYYYSLPSSEIKNENLEELYNLYKESELGDIPRGLDFLLEYRSFDDNVVVKVVEIIIDKVKDDSRYANCLSTLFNRYSVVNKILIEIFAHNIDLLERAYFAVQKIERYLDHEGKSFARILENDNDFILKYVDLMYEEEEWIDRYNDTRDYSFIWLRVDSEKLMVRVAERVYEDERKHGALMETYFKNFFILRKDRINETISAKQDSLLTGLITKRCNEPEFIFFIFRLIANFSSKKRRQLISVFLECNTNFDIFMRLPLEPNHWSWSGSAVPMLQRRMDYLDSLISLLNTVDFLPHKQYIEGLVEGLQANIEYEKKKDFMGVRGPKNI